MAAYTGAQERIALSKKGRTEEEKKRKAGIVELIDAAYVVFSCPSHVLFSDTYREEQDEESMEWELAQVRRAGNATGVQLRTTAPETYEPTPVPPAVPVPVLDAAIA